MTSVWKFLTASEVDLIVVPYPKIKDDSRAEKKSRSVLAHMSKVRSGYLSGYEQLSHSEHTFAPTVVSGRKRTIMRRDVPPTVIT